MSSDSSGPCLSSGFGPIAVVRYSDLVKCCSLVTGTCVCFFFGEDLADLGAGCWRVLEDEGRFSGVLEDEGRCSGVLDLSFVCFFFLGDPPFFGVGVSLGSSSRVTGSPAFISMATGSVDMDVVGRLLKSLNPESSVFDLELISGFFFSFQPFSKVRHSPSLYLQMFKAMSITSASRSGNAPITRCLIFFFSSSEMVSLWGEVCLSSLAGTVV